MTGNMSYCELAEERNEPTQARDCATMRPVPRSRLSASLKSALVLSMAAHGFLLLGLQVMPDETAAISAPSCPRSATEVELVPGARQESLPPRPASEREKGRQRLAVKLPRLEPVQKPPAPAPEEKPNEAPKKEPDPEPKVELLPPMDTARMKMVEVNAPESKTMPDHARFLSDKNRSVEKETRARHTNLEKDHPRPEPFSEPNPNQGAAPGSKEARIAETREQKLKQEGRARRPGAVAKVSPLMRMRGAKLLEEKREQVKGANEATPGGTVPLAQAGVKKSTLSRGPTLGLDHKSLDRIDGSRAAEAREQARLSPSQTSSGKGRFEKKWQNMRAALENFIPEVQPGNQTALSTRAHPFALYIAHMHRQIHKLWGFGFLEDMDHKPDSNPMNNMNLWTTVEVVVLPDGTVDKATIVRPSGLLTYDVAALDTVFSGGPYPPTPREIRSANGKVYLHWRFHRDQRQCGTFGVDPFILTTPPKGPIDSSPDEVKGNGVPERTLRTLNRGHAAGHPLVLGQPPETPPGAQRHPERPRAASPSSVSSSDAGARAVLLGFLRAFERGNAAAMTSACGFPFLAQGRPIATSRSDLQRMLEDLIRETRNRAPDHVAMMTVMEARRALGSLPAGADYGQETLIGRADLGQAQLTMILRRKQGRWQVVGLNR